ncbi:MAG: hypothetical protein Q4P71_00575 [Actinomycetaceae bacterium]|nr:hypothetical protein [Actinomycetaceae bacterium]
MIDRRNLVKLLALSAVGTSLAGCADEVPTLPEPSDTPSPSAVPNLDAQQIQNVLDDLNNVLTQADESFDGELLAQRLKDPALRMRKGFYNLAEKLEESVKPLEIDPSSVTVSQSQTWPRVIVAVTKVPEGELPSVLFITQSDARSAYKLENWARLFPGQSIQTIAVSQGSPVIPKESDQTALSPSEAFEVWISRLDGGDEYNDWYAKDDFTSYYQSERSTIAEAIEAAGTVEMDAVVGDFPITSVKLANETALVSTNFTYTVTYSRTIEGATLKVGGTPAKLLDDPSVTDQPVRLTYLCSVLLSVPPKGSDDLIRAIAAERVLESVERVSNE